MNTSSLLKGPSTFYYVLMTADVIISKTDDNEVKIIIYAALHPVLDAVN